MLNKLESFLREQNMVNPGDRIVCAVSGGADSVALLFACYLLKEKLEITLEAAHFNHHLRGEESDRDEPCFAPGGRKVAYSACFHSRSAKVWY